MRVADGWKDYEILDTTSGEKLERWSDIYLVRPDPQIIWNTPKQSDKWARAHARYLRSSSGGGKWELRRPFEEKWNIDYKGLTFQVKPTGFKHTGLFPEQAVNWDYVRREIEEAGRPLKVLNLFAYTGGATLACAKAGASVCHVDSSKGIVTWARENAKLSHLDDRPIRWIVDDCMKFVTREINRGNRYDAIIMDPPSYGRGTGGEVWKLEDCIYDLVSLCSRVLSDDALFFLLNSYTTGLSPSVMEYLLYTCIGEKRGGRITSEEIGIPVRSTGKALPCGNTAICHCSERKADRD